MSTRPRVAIVDLYWPTRWFVPAFGAAGYDTVRVQSTPDVPPVYRANPIPDGTVDDITHHGDLDATAAAVAAHHPVAVLAGGELGVELADALSERLGTPTNGTAHSAARRHKHTMVETIRAAGLRAADQILAVDEESLRAWHELRGGRVVLKPVRSSGGNGVTFCDTPDESVRGFRTLTADVDIFSVPNTCVVAQEYLSGTEYMVDTVSRDGRHVVTDIWRTGRLAANGVADLADALYLVPAHGPAQDRVVAYARAALDAVGVRHGPAHVEVRDTPDGPCLVELAARIPGGDIVHYAELGTGESQVDLAVEAWVAPERFLGRAGDRYALRRHVACVALVSPVRGRLVEYPHLDTVRGLASFHELRLRVRPGDELRVSVDDGSYPALVDLVHENEETLHHDAATIRWLDGPGFYRLADDGAADPTSPRPGSPADEQT